MKDNFIKPDPDSQFRLLPCGCGSGDVGYIATAGGFWQVKCLRCGHRGSTAKVRHDAQLAWNGACG